KQTERWAKSVAAPAADSGQGVGSLPGPAAGNGSCCLCRARGSALRRAEDRRDSDPGLLATGVPATASIPQWPGPVSCENWTKIATPRRRITALWFVWGSLLAIGSRWAVVCRCPWVLAASTSAVTPERSARERREKRCAKHDQQWQRAG